MSDDLALAADLMTRRYLRDFPVEAARRIEELEFGEVITALSRQSATTLAPVFACLTPDTAARLLAALPEGLGNRMLEELVPTQTLRILASLTEDVRATRTARLEPAVRDELDRIGSYPPDTAGRLMNPGVAAFRRDMTVSQLLRSLGESGMLTARSLFLVDDAGRLTGSAPLQDVALAGRDLPLSSLELPTRVSAHPMDPMETVTRAFQSYRILDLPVVDADGVFLGAVTHDDLARAAQEDATDRKSTRLNSSHYS